MELTELTDAEIWTVTGGIMGPGSVLPGGIQAPPPGTGGNTAIAVGAGSSNTAVVSQLNAARASNSFRIRL